jgi:rSAM/selenodomain-associated transferase 1
MNENALIVFARQPVPGRVKTRLARELGDQAACQVYAELLRITLEAASGVDAARYLHLPPGDVLVSPGFRPGEQSGRDLGERMHRAFTDAFRAGHGRVVLTGSDCPYLTPALLTDAFTALSSHDAVFGPALDGGYYLVGQAAPGKDLFSGIPFSTAEVWALTRKKLEASAIRFSVLPELEDIDEADAWKRYLGQ